MFIKKNIMTGLITYIQLIKFININIEVKYDI